MTLNGWLAIPRSVLTAEWYVRADTFTRALWLHLMLSANFAPTVTRDGLALSPGQVVTSYGALADAMVCRVNGHASKAHPSKVRRALYFLGKGGEATVCPTGRPTYTGIVVTLERWALYASDTEQPTDHATEGATEGLSGSRQHRKNTTGSVDPDERQTAISVMKEYRKSVENARKGRLEVLEVRRREREGPLQREKPQAERPPDKVEVEREPDPQSECGVQSETSR